MQPLKTILVASILMLSFISYAQITIDSSDIGNAGDSFFVARGFDSSITIGAGGTVHQTWDFSLLSSMEMDTIVFIHKDSTQYGSSFPDADFAQYDADFFGAFIYVKKDSQSTRAIGAAVDLASLGFGVYVQDIDPPELVIDFPTTYGSSVAANSRIEVQVDLNTGDNIDSIFIRNTTKTQDADAWGILITPLNSFDVVRIYEVAETVDSIIIVTFGFPIGLEGNRDTTYTYYYWSKGMGFPVATATVDEGDTIDFIDFLTTSPLANFKAEKLKGETGSPFNFINLSSPGNDYLWTFGNGDSSSAVHPSPVYDDPGIYSILLNASVGNVISTMFRPDYINIYPAVDAEFSYTAVDHKATFKNLSTNAVDYLWSFGDGGTSTLKDPLHQFQGEGTYNVKLTASNTGSSRTDSMEITMWPLGIKQQTLPTTFIYPVPTSGNIIVKLSESTAQLFIYSIDGREIYSELIIDEEQQVDLRSLAEGMYYYELITSEGIKRGKLVKTSK